MDLHQKLCIQKSNLHLHLTFIWFIIALVYKYELYTAFIRYPSLTDKPSFRFWQESAYLAFIYLAFIIDCSQICYKFLKGHIFPVFTPELQMEYFLSTSTK